MREVIMFGKFFFMHDVFMHELCKFYGNPEDVKNHLEEISKEHPMLSRFLKMDIEKMNAELQAEAERNIEEKEEIAWEKANNACIDCQFGNGEGGCASIPCYQ